MGPVLVLAGPGAGKTYCLIERIRHLVEELGFDPATICAFTFTNKAAEEITSRLQRDLGTEGSRVKRGTIHAFCAELLREFGDAVGLRKGFGIADEDYQRSILGRSGVPVRFHRRVLGNFTLHRLRGQALDHRDTQTFAVYTRFLERRNLVDFDGLVLKADELLERAPEAAGELRSRWRYVLVDEFQDLNPVQYSVIRRLVQDHQNLFAVGDDEQSIFSWTGADPQLFRVFANEFAEHTQHHLEENHRCPEQTFSIARRLILRNQEAFSRGRDIRTYRSSAHPVRAVGFDTEQAETSWLLADVQRDRNANALDWSDYAVLYRKHEIGDALETSFISAGIPCRLAQGRALADDPVIAYVIAALRVIANSGDSVYHEHFLRVVLPRTLWAALEARAQERGESILRQMLVESNRRRNDDEEGRKLRRARAALRNLEALGRRHTTITALIEELLSHRVGEYRTPLEHRHDELSDPAADPEVVALADRLASAMAGETAVWIAPMQGAGFALRAMLDHVGFGRVLVGGEAPRGAMCLTGTETPRLGAALGVFKALQLLVSRRTETPFHDFTAIDLETTDKDVTAAEIVEIAAVRVRHGRLVEEFRTLVRPRVAIAAGAAATHRIAESELVAAPYFEEVWPAFRDFCGSDALVAHNGYQFDFPILRRMSKPLGGGAFCTFDTLVLARELHPGSRRLPELARAFGIDTGQSHRALDDTRALARVALRLDEERLARARRTALASVLDHLGVALALADQDALCSEARICLEMARPWALGRYSEALDQYRVARDASGDAAYPTLEQLVDRLGGQDVLRRVRAERTPEQRYPVAMARLRRLLTQATGETLRDQIAVFLEQVALSARADGDAVERGRVTLLTLHSTKGLEFSRVYIVGVEDAELPGFTPNRPTPATEIEEGRRLLYVGMTRARDRLVLTRATSRGGRPTGGHQFLTEMGLTPESGGA